MLFNMNFCMMFFFFFWEGGGFDKIVYNYVFS